MTLAQSKQFFIDEGYQTIPFPFSEIPVPEFTMSYEWKFEQLLGYLGTWSAVKHYRKQNDADPVQIIEQELRNAWGDAALRLFNFPVLLRVGR